MDLLDDFKLYAQERLARFTGRKWLLQQVQEALNRPAGPRFVIITGAPGIGKSAFAAHLWLHVGLPTAVHFCIGGRDGTTEPMRFVESVAGQLAHGSPDFAQALLKVQHALADRSIRITADVQTGQVYPGGNVAGVYVQQLEVSGISAKTAFDRLLRQPLQALAGANALPPTVILVDALDEAVASTDSPTIADLLRGVDDLPPQVRFVLTTRPEPRVMQVFHGLPYLLIEAQSKDNMMDVEDYLQGRLKEAPLQSALEDAKWDAPLFISRLSESSEWNFLYLSLILPEIAEGRVRLGERALPRGLDEYYQDLLVSRLGLQEWQRWGYRLLGCVLALQEPVTVEKLAAFLDQEEDETYHQLEQVSQLLDPGLRQREHYWRCHSTVAEFLGDRRKAGAFWCDLRAGHARIARHYLDAWGGIENGLPDMRGSERREIAGGYGLRHLAAHLEGAGRAEDLHRLLRLEQQAGALLENTWYAAKEGAGYTGGYLADARRAWRLAEQIPIHGPLSHESKGDRGIGLQCRYALMTASLNSLAKGIPPGLLAALVEERLWAPAQGLAYARQVPDLGQRAEALNLLVPYLPEAEREGVLREALSAAREIGREDSRAEALAGLAPHLPADLLREALAAAGAIRQGGYRVKALAGLAPYLPADLLREALAAARAIKDAYFLAHALAGLAPHLPADLLREALAAARAFQNVGDRVKLLAGLAPHLPEAEREGVLRDALSAARASRYEDDWARALVELAPHLPADLLWEALATKNEYARARALVGLAPHLPADLLQEALAAARAIQNVGIRMEALVGLAPYLPADLLREALAAGLAIKNEYVRAEALAGLAPHLPADLLREALAAARAIQNRGYRVLALDGLAPHLPADLLREALAAARAGRNEDDWARALAGLAPHLPAELLQEALAAARAIKLEAHRMEALAGLAPHLPADLLQEALAAARTIGYEDYRARALVALAPHLPEGEGEGVLQEALAAARAIGREDSRAKALAGLAPHLPADLLPEALAAVRAIRDEDDRARALAGLASHLPEAEREGGLREALAAARAIKLEAHRADALVGLAPHLPEAEREGVLREALAAARAIGYRGYRPGPLAGPKALVAVRAYRNEGDRARALVRLAPHLPAHLLQEALAIARAIQSEHYRAAALAGLAPHVASLPRSALNSLWQEMLGLLASQTRRGLLSSLRALAPAIAALGGAEAIAETFQAIKDVARWWP